MNSGLIPKMFGSTAKQNGKMFIFRMLLWVFALDESLLIGLHLYGYVCGGGGAMYVCV